jgi:hypothetical protein
MKCPEKQFSFPAWTGLSQGDHWGRVLKFRCFAGVIAGLAATIHPIPAAGKKLT